MEDSPASCFLQDENISMEIREVIIHLQLLTKENFKILSIQPKWEVEGGLYASKSKFCTEVLAKTTHTWEKRETVTLKKSQIAGNLPILHMLQKNLFIQEGLYSTPTKNWTWRFSILPQTIQNTSTHYKMTQIEWWEGSMEIKVICKWLLITFPY